MPRRALISLLLLLAATTAGAVEGELLEPEKAFRFSARTLDARAIEVRYQIADGYYLYRDRFRFEAAPALLEEARLPAGVLKDDAFFGRVETYRGDLRIRIPLSAAAKGPLALKVTSQGCADVGVCYTPQESTARISFISAAAAAEVPKPPAAPAAAPPAPAQISPAQQQPGLLDSLKQLGARLGGDDEVLPPEQAYAVALSVRDARTLAVSFRPEPGYYLYRDKFAFELQQLPGIAVGGVALPAGEVKDDPYFGRTEIYRKPFEAVLTLARPEAGAARGTLAATYQGCKENSVCYPPITKALDLVLPAALAAPVAGAPLLPESDTDRFSRLLRGGAFWAILAGFFAAGIGLTFTPCVLPMIPILSGIIVGQGAQVTHARGTALTAAYVLGMALTYAAAGVLAGLSGSMLAAALQNPWVLAAFALVFVALAFSMFGFYELQLPAALQSRLSEKTNRLHGGHFSAVFGMGALSALIVGPCIAAPLAGALIYISKSGDWVLGGSALFTMALGMGAPLMAVGASGASLLPRVGPWMDSVKRFFGVLLLGLAIWIVSPFTPVVAQMLAWGALFVVSAIYLHAIDPLPAGASGWRKFWKGVGVLALLTGAALLVGAFSGSRDLLQPLGGLRSAAAGGAAPAAAASHLNFERVASVAELDRRLQEARGRFVMLDFYADWCVSCKEMERFTFSDPRVQAKLGGVLLLQADVTRNSAQDAELLRRFGLFGPPGILFFDRHGNEVSGARVIGYLEADRFLATLNGALI